MNTKQHRDTWAELKRHRDRVQAKYEKVTGLTALLATCEAQPRPDQDYIRELRAKLRTARMNLEAMTTGPNDPSLSEG